MNTQSETKLVVEAIEAPRETENPMQERHFGEVVETLQETAEAVFAARRLEVREEAGPILVP